MSMKNPKPENAIGYKPLENGKLRCCNIQAQLYKSKGLYYCHVCQYEYDLSGHATGYHGYGYGVTEADLTARWQAEAAARAS